MKKYLPWIIVATLMLASGGVIYARGGFNEEKKIRTALPVSTNSPTDIPVVTITPTLIDSPTSVPSTVLVTTPTPIATIPSIIRRGGEDD